MSFIFNVGVGRAVESFRRVVESDPATANIVVVAINTSESEAVLKDLDTLALVLANVNTSEVDATNYSRVILTDADLSVPVVDDANDKTNVFMSDIDFGVIDDGMDWTHLVVGFDKTATGDANVVPLWTSDFGMLVDGSIFKALVGVDGVLEAKEGV